MFDIESYNAEWNHQAADSYNRAVEHMEEVSSRSEKTPGPAGSFFRDLSSRVLYMIRLEQEIGRGDLQRLDLTGLMEINSRLFDWRTPDMYGSSWADPGRAVEAFGEDSGRSLALLYYNIASGVDAAYTRRRFQLASMSSSVFKCFDCVDMDGKMDGQKLQGVLAESMQRYSDMMEEPILRALLDPEFRFYRDIMENADPDDPRCLYSYGCHIGEHELRTAAFFAAYPEAELKKMAEVIADAFQRGFVSDGKVLEAGSSLILRVPVGYERLLGHLASLVEDLGLHPVVHRPSPNILNRQANLDHKFDVTLWLDDGYIERLMAEKDALMRKHAGMAEKCRGVMVVTFFGEKPFSPLDKPQAVSPGNEEMERFRRYQNGIMSIQEKYMPRRQMSFTVISFPSPEIGDRFEEIFDATMKMNSVDNATHMRLQRSLIGILDGAESVHVLGRGANRTDLTVALQQPEDLGSKTAFRNCLADINIPVGEVFTSPRLKGTNGILHVEQVMLNRMEFRDLEIGFQDGMARKYTCSNFESGEEGEKFVRKQLFFPHEELPAGEFAIGTNTLAYEMAMKFGIMDLLPVLIIEKMGPHLAIGDTCYAHEEDQAVRNPDGREVVARDNEKTLARKEDPEGAYTHTHIDISIPFHMIGHITVIYPDGSRRDIIREGRFAPDELAELNGPIDRLGI
jgi:aminopeptidase